MTDRDALLRAIIEAPDDDAPRLIYADWLDENGDPARAEFIRVQCDMHGMPNPDDRWNQLLRRSKALLRTNAKRWLKELPGKPAVSWSDRYTRGFLQNGTATRWSRFAKVWRQIYAVTPLTFLVIQSITDQEIAEFLVRPETSFLQHVFLRTTGTVDDAITRLGNSSVPTRWSVLTVNSLNDDSLTDLGARAIIESSSLHGLSSLSLPMRQLSPAARSALVERFGSTLSDGLSGFEQSRSF